jgi:hypothetical protein
VEVTTMPVQLWDMKTPGIYINGDAAFFTSANTDLRLIQGNGGGIGELPKLISKRCAGIGAGMTSVAHATAGRRILIQLAANLAATQAMPTANTDYMQNGPAAANFKLHGNFLESTVYYIPNAEAAYTNLLGIQTPPYIALAHELIHALHSLSGDLRLQYGGGFAANSGLLHEEARTVGLGIYANTRISENAFRRRDGLPLRTYYGAPGDTDNLTGVTV